MKKERGTDDRRENQPMTLPQWNKYIDEITKSESNNLPFVWMAVVLLDKLHKEASAEGPEIGTNGMAAKADGNSNMTTMPDTITTKNEASNNPRSIPYVSGDSQFQRQVGVFTKGKCPVIAPTEDSLDSPEPKPYPVSGSEVDQREDAVRIKGSPEFQEAFDLYSTGKLKLNFLYFFWGNNLGTFFKDTLFDILDYYQRFGAILFRKAIKAMLVSFDLPENFLPDDEIDQDLHTLSDLSKLF